MSTLEMTPAEEIVLRQILDASYRQLLLEIAHADHAEYRDHLRRRAETVEAILTRLRARETAA